MVLVKTSKKVAKLIPPEQPRASPGKIDGLVDIDYSLNEGNHPHLHENPAQPPARRNLSVWVVFLSCTSHIKGRIRSIITVTRSQREYTHDCGRGVSRTDSSHESLHISRSIGSRVAIMTRSLVRLLSGLNLPGRFGQPALLSGVVDSRLIRWFQSHSSSDISLAGTSYLILYP